MEFRFRTAGCRLLQHPWNKLNAIFLHSSINCGCKQERLHFFVVLSYATPGLISVWIKFPVCRFGAEAESCSSAETLACLNTTEKILEQHCRKYVGTFFMRSGVPKHIIFRYLLANEILKFAGRWIERILKKGLDRVADQPFQPFRFFCEGRLLRSRVLPTSHVASQMLFRSSIRTFASLFQHRVLQFLQLTTS